jgi:hypothetical protein
MLREKGPARSGAKVGNTHHRYTDSTLPNLAARWLRRDHTVAESWQHLRDRKQIAWDPRSALWAVSFAQQSNAFAPAITSVPGIAMIAVSSGSGLARY